MDLKECPFCGGNAVISAKWGRYGYYSIVQCELCGCQTKLFKYQGDNQAKDIDWDDISFKRAASAWNRRE